jgi:hypothetical protein
MQRKQQQSKSSDRGDSNAAEMCRARLPGQDRRVLRKRLENAPVRGRVRNPLRRNRTDY